MDRASQTCQLERIAGCSIIGESRGSSAHLHRPRRAKSSTKVETSRYYRNPPRRMRKSAWHLHGKERGLLVSTRASDAGWLCDYASGCYCKGTVSRGGDGIRHPRSLVVAFASREL